MSDIFTPEEDSTPLTIDEMRGLKLSYISTQAELNREEQRNITKAELWAETRRPDILGVGPLKNLHKRMYGDVWDWAGQFTKTHDRFIGVQPYQIEPELRQLLDNVKFWIENNTYSKTEIAARFHHKLVWIHPFPNGNGRHSRLATDLLLRSWNEPAFSWGYGDLRSENDIRQSYIAALRQADQHNLEPLLAFVRTG